MAAEPNLVPCSAVPAATDNADDRAVVVDVAEDRCGDGAGDGRESGSLSARAVGRGGVAR